MFWDNFVKLCAGKNVKPNPVAKELGISSGAVTNWKKEGVTPNSVTLQKIADYFNVSVDYLLGIQAEPEIQENEIPNEITTGIRTIPVLGEIAAGIPIDMIEDIQGYEQLNLDEYSVTGKYFALKIKGDSMEPTISDGSTVIVRQQPNVDNGSIAIVAVNGFEATCKKIIYQANGILLQPINPNYEPIFIDNEQMESEPVTILGKVIEVRTRF